MTFVIAEAGVNHNGSLTAALNLVDAAASAGADAVKFQTFRSEELVTDRAEKAAYQTNAPRADESGANQLAMLKGLELNQAAHRILMARCAEKNIAFLSTPFDLESLRFLHEDLRVPQLKLGSGALTHGPLLLAAARTKLPIILSTGMGTLDEIRAAISVVAFGYTADHGTPPIETKPSSPVQLSIVRDRLTLLHCTSEYPAKIDEVNLRAMETLAQEFGVSVGYSDHTAGINVAIAAAARGASVVEKHFTLDCKQAGPDHAASLEPGDFARMIEGIRDATTALGTAEKGPTSSERRNMTSIRQSLVAGRDIAKGEVLDADSIAVKRPGDGLSPMEYWSLVGTPAARDFKKNDLLVR